MYVLPFSRAEPSAKRAVSFAVKTQVNLPILISACHDFVSPLLPSFDVTVRVEDEETTTFAFALLD